MKPWFGLCKIMLAEVP